MNKDLKLKVLKALRKGELTPEQLTRVLTFKNKKSLEKLMNTINYLYSNDEIIPIREDGQLKLMRRK